MILSYCESILTLRAVESKNVLYGRAVDILLPIVKAILPPGDIFIEDQQLISFNTEFHRTVTANTIQLPQDNTNVVEQNDSFFRDMLDYLKSDSSNSVYSNNNFMITPEHENDLNMMINSMLDGDAV
ncbi:hypothetical protein E3Q22_03547 [Wallemia mellicola]|uniref:Uncharacterized protein n=1 Tax=Wallemia mellicola TaxID=1708541 RepID=A0A4V4MKI7_9BASI|nr:hypothetical protein E3Q22_03547 [Wallemia mellicola]TIB95702.1 hypothetical protein E3Q18_03577 [Wallemia mellicola]